MPPTQTMPVGLESMMRCWMAAEAVHDRCIRFTAAMEAGNVPHAVIGGNAVAAWVGSIDRSAIRNTADVDVLLRRDDIDRAAAAAAAAGFVHVQIGTDFMHVFKDNPEGKTPRQAMLDAVHVIFAGEKVKPTDPVPAPDVTEAEPGDEFRVISLEALVRMKLTSYRLKDQVHLQDMLRVGLFDASWPARFPPPLDARLEAILANPEG